MSTLPGHSCSQPRELVDNVISSSPSRSVAAPRPVRDASIPAGTGALSFGVQPGPNSTSMRRSSTASSDRVNASACPATPARRARHSGITTQSSPVGWPFVSVTTRVRTAPLFRSTGSTSWWTDDSPTPSQRPSSAPHVDVWLSPGRPCGARDFENSTTAASRAASGTPASEGSARRARTAARSRSRIPRPSRSGSSKPSPLCWATADTDRSGSFTRCLGTTAACAATALTWQPERGHTTTRCGRGALRDAVATD
ncbi:hypothetical protein E4K73_47420 [Streptomyces sp. IB201691-2A2]|nr:hypothetical protein E4K73_47420 [Streptomyces sp. IB201691-2A2]